MDDLPPGLYDSLIDELLLGKVGRLDAERLRAELVDVEPADIPARLGELVSDWTAATLTAVPIEQRNTVALEISATLLQALAHVSADALGEGRLLVAPLRRLAAVAPLDARRQPVPIRRPLTPLRDTVLMTNARDQPSVGHEIEHEIDSAERIEAVLAFIRWTGIRSLLPHLRRHVEAGRTLRIITTTYTGSTEQRALEALVDLGADVRVSYDTSTTRLHAKAWLFGRRSGFSTVYIGSSNLTYSAQVTGLEWNVRASQRTNPELVAGFERTFATYWDDPHFERFDPDRFAAATARATAPLDGSILTPFEITPLPFQTQVLEQLRVERQRGHPNTLIAAATGTGKTIMAALDYRHLAATLPRARLLFVAHRSEILDQSRTTFRHVLRDGAFGEMWVGGLRPTRWEHVFASIQSVSANEAVRIDPRQFDVVIVDEFHHAAADSYVALLDHLEPRHLVGLTATPERADGLDVTRWFGGRLAYELRLWDALEQGLLSPFHYFGIHDDVDLTEIPWRRGTGYDVERLTGVYTANTRWAEKVIQAVREKVGDPRSMRALGFCVSIAHAEFMVDCFDKAGFATRAVTAATPADERRAALAALRDGQVQVLFTVDLFNEGVDVPEIDVVLLLRPTESATVFLQQIGRGLRRTEGKDVLTVLDFVGTHRGEFRFDLRFRGLLGRSRRELENDIVSGFPFLPAGCQLDLDDVARTIVLDNVRRALPTRWRTQVAELRSLGDVELETYLAETGLELDDIYQNGNYWTKLRRDAGFVTGTAPEGEAGIGRGVGRLLHLDDTERIETYQWLLDRSSPVSATELDERRRRQFEGLVLTALAPRRGTFADLDEAAAHLWQHDLLRRELLSALEPLNDNVIHLHQPLGLLHPVPIQTHASYNREEILAAFGDATASRPPSLQTGVFFHRPTDTDLLLITLQKSERDYSPTTRYLDYAISDRLFHWESQATTAEASDRGQNYVHHEARGRSVVLFIRPTKQTARGTTTPYFCAGMARYVEHRSERPMQITWRLDHSLPGDVFAAYRAAVA